MVAYKFNIQTLHVWYTEQVAAKGMPAEPLAEKRKQAIDTQAAVPDDKAEEDLEDPPAEETPSPEGEAAARTERDREGDREKQRTAPEPEPEPEPQPQPQPETETETEVDASPKGRRSKVQAAKTKKKR